MALCSEASRLNGEDGTEPRAARGQGEGARVLASEPESPGLELSLCHLLAATYWLLTWAIN